MTCFAPPSTVGYRETESLRAPGDATTDRNPWTVINATVQLRRIVNLSEASQRRVIGTSAQELTGDWRGYTFRNPSHAVSAPYWTKTFQILAAYETDQAGELQIMTEFGVVNKDRDRASFVAWRT